MAVSLSLKLVAQSGEIRFEYALEAEEMELEGVRYIGIGVRAKMVDADGSEITEHIRDVTTEPQVAHRLMRQLQAFRVSPMCLRMFVEDFLACL